MDDEHSIRLIEDVFNFGFIMGVKKGYTNITEAMNKKFPRSDADKASQLWIKTFL